MRNYDTIVLSGGSINGLCILGALQFFFERYDMNITTYIGTSIGSIIGFCLAIGFKPNEILHIVMKSDLFSQIKNIDAFDVIQGGVLKYSIVDDKLKHMMCLKDISTKITMKEFYDYFGKTLLFTTYNYSKSQIEYLSHTSHPNLPCLTALRMSSNLPLIFDQCIYKGDVYIDGGVGDNFPIQLANTPERVLGIYVSHAKKSTKSHSLFAYINEILFIPIYSSVEYKAKRFENDATIVEIKIKSSHFDFDFSQVSQSNLFIHGYNSCKISLN